MFSFWLLDTWIDQSLRGDQVWPSYPVPSAFVWSTWCSWNLTFVWRRRHATRVANDWFRKARAERIDYSWGNETQATGGTVVKYHCVSFLQYFLPMCRRGEVRELSYDLQPQVLRVTLVRLVRASQSWWDVWWYVTSLEKRLRRSREST